MSDPKPEDERPKNRKFTTGEEAGIAIGVILLILLLLAGALFYWYKFKRPVILAAKLADNAAETARIAANYAARGLPVPSF